MLARWLSVISVPVGLLVLAGPTQGLEAPLAAHRAASVQTGGATTVPGVGRNAFSFPAANLTDAERTRFAIGNSFFKRNWVEAPASTQARDGLGPHFIARSCGGCHVQDGRGAPPSSAGEQPVALLLRLSVPGVGPHGGIVPEPTYGDQLNNAAVQQVRPEARIRVTYAELPGQFADGDTYTRLQPQYQWADLGYGPMAATVLYSPRIAPQLIGVGLLEAIPEAEIRANAQHQAAQPGPIKGVPNEVWDAQAQRILLGRYGWKANVASIAHQTAGAFNGDLGITSTLFPAENCTPRQADCLAAPHGNAGRGPEISDDLFRDVVFYQATLAPPARRNPDAPATRRGEELFHQVGCAVCHRPSYRTGPVPFPTLSSPALQDQLIWPYTDLLLHDLGPGLADGRPDYGASGSQWKTPPLWGIGLIPAVNGHQRLLHDGRARGVLEAIVWHGGEAAASAEAVRQLQAQDRAALVQFVESL